MDDMSDDIVVVIPVHRSTPDRFERMAYKQCMRILGDYPITLVASSNLRVRKYIQLHEINVERFPPNYFRGVDGYNKLLVSVEFYSRFRSYQHILIHQLDAFVFRDELTFWCDQGYDFIGAPWYVGFAKAQKDSPFLGVGNGGFSLRKTDSFLKVLHTFSWIKKPDQVLRDYFRYNWKGRLANVVGLVKKLTVANNTFHSFNDHQGSEDLFWGKYANRNFSWFQVPSPNTALQFSFEKNPRQLFELNDCNLPFGCHAWQRYDYEFWKPFIEEYGYALP